MKSVTEVQEDIKQIANEFYGTPLTYHNIVGGFETGCNYVIANKINPKSLIAKLNKYLKDNFYYDGLLTDYYFDFELNTDKEPIEIIIYICSDNMYDRNTLRQYGIEIIKLN